MKWRTVANTDYRNMNLSASRDAPPSLQSKTPPAAPLKPLSGLLLLSLKPKLDGARFAPLYIFVGRSVRRLLWHCASKG